MPKAQRIGAFLIIASLAGVGAAVFSRPQAVAIQSTNGTIYVDCARYSCSDIGVTIDSAYEALPSAGGTIVLPASATCLRQFTTIDFATAGKPVLLRGSPGGGTCIEWQRASGTAMVYDVGTSHMYGAGMRDVELTTGLTSNKSIGLYFGAKNGGEGTYWSNNTITGFKYSIETAVGASNVFVAQFIHNVIGGSISNSNSCAVGISLAGSSENLTFFDNGIISCAIGVSVSAAGTDVYLDDNSFDENTVVAVSQTTGAIFARGNHFENPGGSTAHYWTNTGGNAFIDDGVMLDDVTTGRIANFVSSSGTGTYTRVTGVELFSSGRVVANAVEYSHGSLGEVNVFSNGPSGRIAHTSNSLNYGLAGGAQVVDVSQNYSGTQLPFMGKLPHVFGCSSPPPAIGRTLLMWFDCTAAWPEFNANAFGNLAEVGTASGGTTGHIPYWTSVYTLGDAGAGFTGKKSTGGCTFTISHGIITNVTGC